MEIDGNTVIFKSVPFNFKAEQRGTKPNTERLLNSTEFKALLTDENEKYPVFSYDYLLHRIRIGCTDPNLKGYDPFERELTDIRKIGELCGSYLVVFSWMHEPWG